MDEAIKDANEMKKVIINFYYWCVIIKCLI